MNNKAESQELNLVRWYSTRSWKPFPFQLEMAEAYNTAPGGLLNAPTGSGKTFALALPVLLQAVAEKDSGKGLRLLWITPLKALSKDIAEAIRSACNDLGLDWQVAVRSGDTSGKERQEIDRQEPQVLVTTPESLHLLLSRKAYSARFAKLRCLVFDEWHELLGSKRGVQAELALSRLRGLLPNLKVWGISATVGNLDEALEVLHPGDTAARLVRSGIRRRPEMTTLIPEEVQRFPWSGHLGIRMLNHVLPVLEASDSTLVFTNTRSQTEIWYRELLEAAPQLAGRLAIHHGSLSQDLRSWVEQALHEGRLKAVVCTSSLDLGVDFRPVDSVVQIGSPKGLARFLQRAGRSGHRPDAQSRVWFVPTHSLELVEAAALRHGMESEAVEAKIPVVRAFDVLLQYLVTLSCGEGFDPEVVYREVQGSYAFASLTRKEWEWCIAFLTTGGTSLQAYDEYRKIHRVESKYHIVSRRMSMLHRLNIGTIHSDQSMQVKMQNGPSLGTIEESFISRLNTGDAFVFAGRTLELVGIRANVATVKPSRAANAIVPSWQGGRMSLSSEISVILRRCIENWQSDTTPEMQAVRVLFETQAERSAVPGADELLIELHHTDQGHHLYVFPFEGRMVNEGMAILLAYRLSRIRPMTFSIAINDYGFELLSADPIPLEEGLEEDLFNTDQLMEDLYACANFTEMTRRRFSYIAAIGGLVLRNLSDRPVKARHLQANASLFYETFRTYEPDNLLLRQAEEEVFYYQLEEHRLRDALKRLQHKRKLIKRCDRPTPFAFPIMVDMLSREQLSNESLEARVERMLKEALA